MLGECPSTRQRRPKSRLLGSGCGNLALAAGPVQRSRHRTLTQVPAPRSSPLRTECHVSGTRGSVHPNNHCASRTDRLTQPPLVGSPKLVLPPLASLRSAVSPNAGARGRRRRGKTRERLAVARAHAAGGDARPATSGYWRTIDTSYVD